MPRAKTSQEARSFVLFGTNCQIGGAKWELRNDTPGSKNYLSTINWKVALPDGSDLTDPQHEWLLAELQIFIVSRVIDPRGAAAPSASTCGLDGRALRTLARWMVDSDIATLSDISTELSWDYLDFAVAERTANHTNQRLSEKRRRGAKTYKSRALSFSTIWRDVNVLIHIFQQEEAMRLLGCSGLEHVPFDGRSAKSICEEDLGLSRDGRLKPIPDDVAVPTLNAATRMLGAPAKDIMELQELHDGVRELSPGAERTAAYEKNIQRIQQFEFSTIDGERSPWREPLEPYERSYRDGRKFRIKESQGVRRLVVQLQTACIIAMQGLTGIRAHELIGTEVEEDLISGLPSCVEVETRRDGTVRKYYLRSKTFKKRRQKERWLLGSSVVGSNRLPIPVSALLVLHQLNSPWRKLGSTKSLLTTFTNRIGFPRQESSIGHLTVSASSVMQKEFVKECVDLTAAGEESRLEFLDGGGLRPHRWRTTFAMFVMRVSPKLIPALSDHYKHVNAVVTEEGYIGINPALRDDMTSARVQTSAEYLLRLTEPNAVILGGGAKRFKEHAESLREMMSKEPGISMYERAISLVDRLELFLYDAAHGQCLSAFAPHLSRCNALAGYAGQLKPFPNDAFRTVATCSACEVYVVTAEHAHYFEERIRACERDMAATNAEEEPGIVRVIQQRARQSRQVLKLLKAH